MFKLIRLSALYLYILLALTALSLAYPSSLNTTTTVSSRDGPCKCAMEGRFCIGLDDGLTGNCPADAIITCRKKNVGKGPNQIQYCNQKSVWARSGSQCYRKKGGKNDGKLKCS
ncbi:hypothetical protein BKA65DRAFT_537791 [Rhexocercosporidium sp. MPI-PUGE-AT-0058]|nr:hypothetical protein BKA65DRAFT_537791 [Rhexocercosporidium sp. MPI-PUGE-AT-0058]